MPSFTEESLKSVPLELVQHSHVQSGDKQDLCIQRTSPTDLCPSLGPVDLVPFATMLPHSGYLGRTFSSTENRCSSHRQIGGF